MSILRVIRSNAKHCVLHNGMITWNSLPDAFKVNLSISMFQSNVRIFDLEKYWDILMLSATMITFFSDMHESTVFHSVIVLIIKIVLVICYCLIIGLN